MELLGKAVDAASMFWQALDTRERMILAYAGAWVVFSLIMAAQRRSRDRLRAEILEELHARSD